MRGGWGERCVPPSGTEPALGERREVVGVNNVMRDARMLWLACQSLLKERTRFELARISLVGVVDGFVDGERVEDDRLGVVAVPSVDLFHGLLVGEDPRFKIPLFRVAEV